MAESYPLNLDSLKRAVDLAEQMNVNVDMNNQTIEQRLRTLKDAILLAQGTYNNGIESNKDEFNALIDRVRSIGTDLKDKLDALDLASNGDADALAGQISALRTLLEGDAGVTIINTLDAIADEINTRTATLTFPVSINDETGKGVLDISALGLASTSDYSATLSQNATSSFVFANAGIRKIDAGSLEVIAYDGKYTPETAPLYDGSSNPANYIVAVHYLRPLIEIEITETDGTAARVGN